MNNSGVQAASPVSWGVRLAAKLVPHGPAHAVPSALLNAAHPAGFGKPAGSAGTGAAAGQPASNRVVSRLMLVAVKIFAVWQSLQPPKFARYWPRRAGSWGRLHAARASNTSRMLQRDMTGS